MGYSVSLFYQNPVRQARRLGIVLSQAQRVLEQRILMGKVSGKTTTGPS